MRVRLKNCAGGYFLPPNIQDGQRAIVVGFEHYSIVVRVKGAQLTLPGPTVDAGTLYQLPDGRWIDDTDRRVQKMRARSEAHLRAPDKN